MTGASNNAKVLRRSREDIYRQEAQATLLTEITAGGRPLAAWNVVIYTQWLLLVVFAERLGAIIMPVAVTGQNSEGG